MSPQLMLIYTFLFGIFVCIVLSMIMGLKEGIIGGLIIWGFLGGIEITIYLITIIFENSNKAKSLPNQFSDEDLNKINKKIEPEDAGDGAPPPQI